MALKVVTNKHRKFGGYTGIPISLTPGRMRVRATGRIHRKGGNRFTDFFKKTIPNWFTKPVNLPSGVEKALNFMRDKVNPGIVSAAKSLANIPIPGLSKGFDLIGKVGDQYLKVMPPNPGGSGLQQKMRAGKRGKQKGGLSVEPLIKKLRRAYEEIKPIAESAIDLGDWFKSGKGRLITKPRRGRGAGTVAGSGYRQLKLKRFGRGVMPKVGPMPRYTDGKFRPTSVKGKGVSARGRGIFGGVSARGRGIRAVGGISARGRGLTAVGGISARGRGVRAK